MKPVLLILGACCATLAGCYVPSTTLWPPRDPVHAWVPPAACDVRSAAVDCFDHVVFAIGDALVMEAPACADVTVRRWSDKLPNGVVTVFYRTPPSYSVIGAATDRPVLIQCLQYPLLYPVVSLMPKIEDGDMGEKNIYPVNGGPRLPKADGVAVKENPDDKVYSDKYVPE